MILLVLQNLGTAEFRLFKEGNMSEQNLEYGLPFLGRNQDQLITKAEHMRR